MTNGRPEAGTLEVLLVEDNPGDARLLAEYLSEAELIDAAPEPAATLEAALGRLRDGAAPPDVVLLDLGLPDAGGLEAVEAVVAAAPALPVVVLTGRDDRETAVEALREGAEDYLLKGEVEPDALARSVRYAVERKRAETELRERVKEQSCLYDVSQLLHADERNFEERLQGVVDRLPEGWQYPETTAARLRLEDAEWTTDGFAETEWSLAAPITTAGDRVGRIEVCYRDERPEEEIGPFMREEQTLLEAIADQIGVAAERRDTRRELEAERARLAEVFENAPAWVATLSGPDHVFEMVNPTYHDLVGDREVVGRTVRQVFPELEGEPYFELLDRVYETGETVEVKEQSLPLETEEGEVEQKYITLVYQPRYEDGEVVGIYAHGVEVTEQVQARDALERAKEMFKGVFETSPVGLKIVDAETREFRAVNEGFTQYFGYTREEVEEGAVRDEDLWPDLGMRARIYDRVTEGETVRNVEVRLRRKDGSTFDALFSASSLVVGDRQYVVGAVQDISYQKEVERELTHRAFHDELTGLANRALLDDRLGQALERSERTGEALAVCFVDLKRFKVINDSLGHEAGDRVLEAVAERMAAAVREQDTVARIGGDEFAVLLEDVEGEEEARRGADAIVRSFEEPVPLGDRDVAVEASVGVAVHEGAGTEQPNPTDLLRWAEEAMHRASNRPGTAHVLADPDHPTSDTSAIEREQRFRAALEEGRIGTVYQPVVGARDGELRGVEALCRWHDPELGQVSPGTFIPIAEETGLIVQLGEQQLEEGCRSLLAEDGLGSVDTDRPLRLQVNLSSYQLEDPEVVDRVRGVLERTGFPAARLCLEVTESAAAREPEVVERLREMGLKIDRSFVDGLPEDDRDRAIVESVLTLGHALGLTVVAEGVETAEQWELLGELGVDEVQGYHFARPMPFEELREWIEARS